VPGSTPNLGPVCDTLGVALDLVNTVRVEPSDRWEMIVEGEGADRLTLGDRNLLYRAMTTGARRWAVEIPPARLLCANVIPLSRGLGSSSAAIIAGLLIAARLAGANREQDDILHIASEIEGHPDNVAPALLGGVQVCALSDGQVAHVRVPLAKPLNVALFVPEVPMPTREARAVIPRRIDLHDAVYNI